MLVVFSSGPNALAVRQEQVEAERCVSASSTHPTGDRLIIRNLKTSASTKATMLGVPRKLAITARDNSVTIRVPELTVETVPCGHAYTFKITESELMPE